jgi:hypothetical protein
MAAGGFSGDGSASRRRRRGRSRRYYGLLISSALVTGVGIAAYAETSSPPTQSELAEIMRVQQARIETLERQVEEQSRLLAQTIEAAELDKLRGGALPTIGLSQIVMDAQGAVVLTQLAPAEERLAERPEPTAPRPWPRSTPPPPQPNVAPAPPPQPNVAPAPPPTVAEFPEVEEEEEASRPLAERPEEPARAEDLLLVERGAILLPKGRLQLEGSLDYTRFSGPRVVLSGLTLFEAIHIGLIRVEHLERDVLTAAATARYGIMDRLQADVRVPFVYRTDSEVRGIGMDEQTERRTWITDIGDVSARLSYQAVIGNGLIPDVILRAEGQFPTGQDPFGISRVEVEEGVIRLAHPPTGSGFYEIGGGGLFTWRVDPVVFYTGGTYTHRLARNIGDPFGKIAPGDTIQAFAGVNMRLTDRFGLNLSFIDQITMATERNGQKQPGTRANDGRVIIGTSLALNPSWALLGSAGIGLTSDAPDFQFTLSLSHSLDLGR